MSDKAVPNNRHEVSELVERCEMMSLPDIKHKQLKVERGWRI